MYIRKSSIKRLPLSRLQLGERASRALPFFLLFVVCAFILYPIIMLVVTSFNHGGAFDLSAYVDVFSSGSTYKVLWNTFCMEAGILIGCWMIGGSLAFLRHKTDFKHKRLLDTCVFLSFTIPAYILAISWVQVFANNGYLRHLLQAVFPGYKYSINAYTLWASSLVLTLHVYPLVYYGVGNALKLLGNPFEQSAKICGASKLQVIFRVIIPLVIPSFISTGLLVVSRTMANFGVPAQLAMPTGTEVLTTRVYSAMADLNLPIVAVLSMLLVAVSVVLFLLSERGLKNRTYDSKMSSMNTEKFVIELGRWEKLISIITGLFFILSLVLPMLSIFVSSFFKRWGLAYKIENLTFRNYARLFTEENILSQPLVNSLTYGIIAATTASILASLIVYFYNYKRDTVSNWVMNISQLPIAIPNIILAVAAMFAWINEPFKLYGTSAIIIITYVVLFTPICIKQMLGASKNIDHSMDDAARTMGIPVFKRYTRLFLPVIKESLLSGFLICFLISLKEIPISLLLFSAGTKTLGVMLFVIQTNAYGLEMTSAIAVIVIALSATGHIILNKIGVRGYRA